jgi:hypothetical protein
MDPLDSGTQQSMTQDQSFTQLNDSSVILIATFPGARAVCLSMKIMRVEKGSCNNNPPYCDKKGLDIELPREGH